MDSMLFFELFAVLQRCEVRSGPQPAFDGSTAPHICAFVRFVCVVQSARSVPVRSSACGSVVSALGCFL